MNMELPMKNDREAGGIRYIEFKRGRDLELLIETQVNDFEKATGNRFKRANYQ